MGGGQLEHGIHPCVPQRSPTLRQLVRAELPRLQPQRRRHRYDYVICKLYNPLGHALGWMGSASFGNEDDYYNKRFVSSGYPGRYGERPAVELDMAVADIDNDSPGKELEFGLRADLGPGWSGGPLWHHTANRYVVGVLSGQEKDGLDPTRLVYAGGGGLVDLVRFGQTNWPA